MYGIRDVTSGVPQKACWAEFSIIYMGTWPTFECAASCAEEIPSCLGTDPKFQHRPFQQW